MTAFVIDEMIDGPAVRPPWCLVGSAVIVVTRHRPPVAQMGMGAGMECTVMWHDSMADYRASVRATTGRLMALVSELRTSGLRRVVTIDCFPSDRLFRSLERREVDAVVRALQAYNPDQVLIDETHHLAAQLQAALAAKWGEDRVIFTVA